ncbi:DUF6544 family protein [Flagellimonas lutaonensis]|uniref:Uncharacterized protein n=1 Tax=Flagellimonas lutaonensis TaxID=516051 RepID=A0A0D5YPX3_9FLAO|nr:DUF6544 family protein [Allomuricauda lutaonensis]AKA34287.1 hypothetical protein VC82_617 [Allomuricauda lutaonensis]
MRIVLLLILLFHGLIHFMGFAKAFHFGNLAQFTKDIPKPMGLLWLLTGLLFIVSGILYMMKKDAWPILAIIAVVLSQILIFMVWTDAKFGTIANVIVLIMAIMGYGTQTFENSYKKDVAAAMQKMVATDEVITESDLATIPEPVRNYLNYVGVVGKPKLQNVKIVFEGEMRDRGKAWFKFTSEQYNFFDDPTRLFFMKAKVLGLPTTGYHRYTKDGAGMMIKLLSLFPVAKVDGPAMFPTETVTFFNDLCLFAPVALIDDRIQWETMDKQTVKTMFTVNGTTISAMLYFNEKGQLVNFVSDDRISVDEMKTYPFSTPTGNYQNINGYNLPTYGEAVWHYPDGEFVYGKFNLKSIEYNVSQLQEK